MAFINLIPHEVTLITKDGHIVLPPAEEPARVDHNVLTMSTHNGVPVKAMAGPIRLVGLPEPRENTFFLVSRIVKEMAIDRDDVVVPSDIVRDSRGHIVGAKAVSL